MSSISNLNIGGDSSEEDEYDQEYDQDSSFVNNVNNNDNSNNNKQLKSGNHGSDNTKNQNSSTSSNGNKNSNATNNNTTNTNNPTQVTKPSIVLFQNDEEEDEEMDEPLQQPPSIPLPPVVTPSTEFMDALQAVQSNPNDTTSWYTYLIEIKTRNYGSMSLSDAYKPFFSTFPKSYFVYIDYVTLCIELQQYSEADEIFAKVLNKSRNVYLWVLYTNYVKTTKRPLDRIGRSLDDYNNDRRAIESAYEQAVDNIGLDFNSYPLWKEYIDFIKSWPDSGLYSDIGRKLLTLRKVYQRVISIPIENLDIIWREYEILEKQAGEHLAEKVLPEYQEKYLHAKTIYQDRKKYTTNIEFHRLATQPMKDLKEIQQLDYWNKWIKFELTNPDNLSMATLNTMLRMIFDQCLCCFTRHPEIWMSLAKFEMDTSGVSEAKVIYREAIEHIPKVATLRFAYAELEEMIGNYDIVKDILKSALQNIPSGYTFSVYQRFIRRREGIIAARKLFSETVSLRQEKSLAFEISLAHAQLELDTNADAATALKVLQITHKHHPVGCPILRYTHLQVRCLLRLGDVKQLQWVMNNTINELGSIIAAYYLTTSSGETIPGVGVSGLSIVDEARNKIPEGFDLLKALRDQLYLLEEYLHAEIVLGLSDVSHIISIKQQRDKAKAEYEEFALIQSKKSITSEELNEKYRGTGLFQLSYELNERYDLLCSELPPNDGLLRERSTGKKLLDILTRQDIERKMSRREHTRRGGGAGGNSGSSNSSERDKIASELASSAELSSVPYILRELLVHLPSHTGPLPDIDHCLRQLKNIVLPPRPISDDSLALENAGSTIGSNVGNNSSSNKRSRENETNIIGTDWMASTSGIETDEVEEELLAKPDGADTLRSDDIFRQRQRARLLL